MSALGNKYVCIQCEAKFYDLRRNQAICPSCGSDQSAAEETVSEPVTRKAKETAAPDGDAGGLGKRR